MTHADIYKKFMIEYDKANIASSYPSLTPYEVATILDKAYLALIARKMTGNNPRLSTFESDTKSIEDLRPLIVNKVLNRLTDISNRGIYADNEYAYKFNDDMLYYIEGLVYYNENTPSIDQKGHKNELVNLVSHELAQHFKATNTNMPWIKQPVSFIENDYIHVLVDSYKHRNAPTFYATYLKKPKKFVSDDNSSGGQGGSDPQITVSDPEITPKSKTFSDPFTVTISTRDGDSIYYTTDGSNPKTVGTEYTSPIDVYDTTTIKAAAYKNGTWSNVVTEVYTKQQGLLTTVAAPTFSPENETFEEDHLDVLISATPGDRIYYAINSINNAWNNYTGAIRITDTTTIYAYATRTDETGVHTSNTTFKKYTKQLQQDPQLGSASVSIELCYYQLNVQGRSENVRIEYKVSKTNYTGDLYVKINLLGVNNEERQVKSLEKVERFNSNISFNTTNFRYTDTNAIVILYDKNNNEIDRALLSINNMPVDIPTVTILECKYVPADGNTPERIKIVHSINLKNSNIAVDRFINVVNESYSRRVETTGQIEQNINNEENFASYISGDFKITIAIVSAISGVLCNLATKNIDNLPSSSPEVPDPDTQHSTLGLFRLGESRIK